MKPLYWLLVAVPVAILAHFAHANAVAVFALACLGLVPLAEILGDATEDLSVYAGQRIGGLLNATLGNAAELIIAGFAIKEGLLDLVKASITGSILGNVLLVLGMSLVAGGVKHRTQRFNAEQAGIAATMMILSVIALAVPAMFGELLHERNSGTVETLSVSVAAVMMVIYLLALYYTIFWNVEEQALAGVHHTKANWTKRQAIGVLVASTAAIIVLSELLVSSVEPVIAALGVSQLFLGIILIPLVGNVAEHLVAVEAAWKNRMDLSLAISMGSSTQVALFVAPLLVFLSLVLGHPMDLIFTPLELAALGAASAVALAVSVDGQSNWLEGAMLLAVYALLGLAFFHWPLP